MTIFIVDLHSASHTVISKFFNFINIQKKKDISSTSVIIHGNNSCLFSPNQALSSSNLIVGPRLFTFCCHALCAQFELMPRAFLFWVAVVWQRKICNMNNGSLNIQSVFCYKNQLYCVHRNVLHVHPRNQFTNYVQ